MKKYTIIATVLLAVVLTIGIAAVILEKVNSDTLQTERPEVTSTGGIPSPTPDSTEICTPSTYTENAVTTTPTAEITSTVIPTHTGILIGFSTVYAVLLILLSLSLSIILFKPLMLAEITAHESKSSISFNVTVTLWLSSSMVGYGRIIISPLMSE